MTFQPRLLGELCLPTVETVDPKRTPEREFWYIDISAVDNVRKQIVSPQRVMGKSASVRARQKVCANDVIVATTRPNLNAVALVSPEYDGQVCSTGFCVLRPGEELDVDYLFSFVRSRAFVEPLTDLTQGALYPAVTDKQVFAQNIPWVPLDEQRRIAARLKAQLAEVETARQAAQVQAQDIAVLRNRLLAETFSNLDAEPAKLGNVVLGIQAGKSFQTAETPARADELGVLKVSAVSWSAFRPEEAKALKGEYQPEDHHRVCQGDFLISRANTKELVGAVVLVDHNYPLRLLSDKTLRLIINEERACKNYLLYALRSPAARNHIEHFATGTSDSMRNIAQDVITSTPIALPPLTEQRLIAAKLKARLAEVDNMQRAVDVQQLAFQALPGKLLAQAFEH